VPVVGEDPPAGEQSGAGAGEEAAGGPVNLNTADQVLLETLPRIGPALAQRILEWREQNGRFGAVDDLLAVSGIGEKMLENLRPLVTV
jgi:competence protein ComEA